MISADALAAYAENASDYSLGNAELQYPTASASQHSTPSVPSLTLHLGEDWLRLALVLIAFLLPLRLLGYSLGMRSKADP